MNQEPFLVGVDLKSKSMTADLLDCISGFPLFVDGLRANGAGDEFTAALIADLINLFRKADEHGENLSLLGALAPRHCRVYDSFYILDNSIREDRFDALVKIFSDAGYSVISPNLDGASEAEVLDRIDSAQVLRKLAAQRQKKECK